VLETLENTALAAWVRESTDPSRPGCWSSSFGRMLMYNDTLLLFLGL